MRAALLSLLISVLALPALAQRAANMGPAAKQFVVEDAEAIALENVRLIDGTGSAAMEGVTVLIEGGRISAVGTDVDIPPFASRHDLAGHTVIPGMVGLHNHTFYTTSARRVQASETAPLLYLASGVTTIRTTGSYHPYSEINLKEAVRLGERAGPRMFVTGPYITGGEGMTYMTRLGTAEDARRVVRYWAEEGVDWIKAYTLITREELAAAVDEAHKHGVKVTGHLCSVSFKEAVAAGIDNLEHGFFTNTDYDADRAPDTCPGDFRNSLLEVDMESDEIQSTFRAMIDAGVPMTSTLAVYEMFVPNRPPLEQRTLDAMSEGTRSDFLLTRAAISEQNSEVWRELFPRAQAFERAFVAAGGLLGAGVDPTGYGGALPGFGDQRNYELLREAGFSAEETVQIMSLNGARILGIEDATGSVEVGKEADLVVIEGDPAANPTEIRGVRLVFRNGIGYDSAAMIEAVRGEVGIR
ncbi:MAG: amidohydrolase family protein [Rhodothermales bacterium]|nr:amidohydrolase family protein [Rhodothermales bacterium]MBO6778306.1 amidohydrolase family protein [Rhodothermales bacterium]